MKRVIDIDERLYNTCKRLVSEGDPRPSESCIADSEPYEPQGKWFDFVEEGTLKARHGEYVLYKVDYLLDNLAREVNIMESARRMKGGAE